MLLAARDRNKKRDFVFFNTLRSAQKLQKHFLILLGTFLICKTSTFKQRCSQRLVNDSSTM